MPAADQNRSSPRARKDGRTLSAPPRDSSAPRPTGKCNIGLVWDNFGPSHADRCDALSVSWRPHGSVFGIEVYPSSNTYAWRSEPGRQFKKITLFPDRRPDTVSWIRRARSIVAACLHHEVRHVFLCHYEHPSTFAAAWALRLLGRRVFVMNDSKFDDYDRLLWRELAKSVMYLPYNGGLAAGKRSRSYMSFLGLPPDRISEGYDALDVDRISALAAPQAVDGSAAQAADRHFSIVARLVPKKNISTAIAAYALYADGRTRPRALHIYGSGPLEDELRAQVDECGMRDRIKFLGFLQTEQIGAALGSTFALIHPSIEEQFGFAILEAQAAGIPVITTPNCGACDQLLRSGVNGFLVEPDNPAGIAFYMRLLDDRPDIWSPMCTAARQQATRGDVEAFCTGVRELVSCAP